MKTSQRLSLGLALLGSVLSCGLLAYAGQLLFDGVPVDITTAANEDLVIAPGEGGITQIGDKTGATRDIATSNDDLLITNNLEVEGKGRIEGALTVKGAATLDGAVTLGDATGDDITVTGLFASNLIPKTDSTYDLGSSSLAFSNLYVDTVKSITGNNLSLSPVSGKALTATVTRSAATGNETLFDLSGTVNKATSGNYTGLLLNVTETAAPGSLDRLLDLQVGGTRQLQIFNGIASTANYGLLSVGAGAFDGSTTGFFAGSSSGTLIAGNTASGFAGNLLDLQVAGTSVYKVDASGNVTQSGITTQSGNLDMTNNLILNIGNASTDFTTGGGLTLAGDLTISGDDLFMTTNTSGAVLVADGTNFNPVVMGGQATISTAGSVTVSDMTCTDCLNATEIEDIYVLTAGDTMTGALLVDGSADAIQLTVQGNATQTTNLFVAENSAGTDQFTVSNAGNVVVTGDLTITGDDLFMTTNTSGAVLVADGTNFNPVVMSGDATIGTTGALAIAANVLDFGDFEDTLDVDAALTVNFAGNTGTITSTLVGSPFALNHSGALNGSDAILTLNADSTSSSGTGNVAFKIDVDDADVDALIAGDGTNYTTIQDDGKIVYTANAQPNRTMILTGQGGLLLSTQTTAQSNVDGTNFAYSTLDFDQTTSEKANWGFVIPDSFTGTTATFTPYWTAASGSGAVVWEFDTGGFADNEAFNGGALGGTAATSTDTLQTANAMHIGPAATVTHDWTAGDFAVVQIARLPADAGDTLNADARILAVKIEWAASAESD